MMSNCIFIYWGWDEMAAILQTAFFLQWKGVEISLKFVPQVSTSIDNKSALVQVMAWHPTGYEPLHELIMTQFRDAYMRHPASKI